MLGSISGILAYFKEVPSSLKFQLSAAITFGAASLLLWLKVADPQIYLAILFLFPTCMLVGSIIEKIINWRNRQKEKRIAILNDKLGRLGSYQFTDRLNELWPDQNFRGLGWQILVDTHTNRAFLTDPACLACKTDLVARTNAKVDGFCLECTDCKQRFEVNDIGETRSLANASLQGEARRNPDKFFDWI